MDIKTFLLRAIFWPDDVLKDFRVININTTNLTL